jgi:hypothetical protein
MRPKNPQDFRVRAFHARGPHVRPQTKATIESWRHTYGVPYGRQIDAMVDFCLFHPGFKLPVDEARSNLDCYDHLKAPANAKR